MSKSTAFVRQHTEPQSKDLTESSPPALRVVPPPQADEAEQARERSLQRRMRRRRRRERELRASRGPSRSPLALW